MPAARIQADESGRLSVPPEPVVAVVPGDGRGAELWAVVRRELEWAVAEAYAGRRRLHFDEQLAGEAGLRSVNDPAPEAAVQAFRLARVGFDGGWRRPAWALPVSLADALRGILDLYAVAVTLPRAEGADSTGFPAEAALHLDLESTPAVIELGLGEPASLRLSGGLERAFPQASARLPYATPAAVEADERARDEAPSGIVESAFSVRGASPQGARRAAVAAVQLARALGRERLVFADDAYERPLVSRSRRAAVAEALQGVGVPVEFVRVERLVTDPARLSGALVSLPEADGLRLLQVLAGPYGGLARASVARVNLETGHGVFGPWLAGADAAAEAYAGAARQLLVHLGWREAAARLAPQAIAS
jgi:isocitrate dehydrogenase